MNYSSILSTHQVAKVNQLGVCSMVRGNYDESLSSYRIAFKHVQEVIRQQDDDHHPSGRSEEEKTHFSWVLPSRLTSVPLSKEGMMSCFSWNATDGAFELFDCALVYELCEERSEDTARENAVLAAVVLYNGALCHHVRGTRMGCSKDLERALHLYKLSSHLITKKCRPVADEEPSSSSSSSLLILALLNNMGHIHSYFHNITDAQNILAMMKVFLDEMDPDELTDRDAAFFALASVAATNGSFVGTPAA